MQRACRKLFIVWLGIVLVASGLGTVREEASAASSIELYTPYTEVTVPPGESVNYSIELINRTDSTIILPITLAQTAAGWQYELTAGGRATSRIAVKPDEAQAFNLKLDVPMEVDKGTYSFQVAAGDAATLPFSVIVSEKGTFRTELEASQANMEGHADTTFSFSAVLRNRTGEKQTYALKASGEAGWDIRFRAGGSNVTSVTVEPNASETINVDAIPPTAIEAGTYQIPIQAFNNATSSETTLEAVITGSYGLTISTANDLLSSDITAGAERKLELAIANTGTAEMTDVSLSATSPSGWEVSFEPSTIRSIAAGQSVQAIATIRADSKSLAGDYIVGLTASAPQKSASATLRMTVKTSVLWGWIGVAIIAAVIGGIYWMFRKYGRR